MATLNQLYNTKDSGVTVKKTHNVPFNQLYIEEGFNIRGINWQRVEEFKQSYIEGSYVPPLVVTVTDKGVKIIDGHHRYHGAEAAIREGYDIARLECKDFIGTPAEATALMVTSTQGEQLLPLERANAYWRMINQGLTREEIAKKVKRSISDVANHLALSECGNSIKAMVKDGSMSYATAVEIQREHGVNAEEKAKEMLAKAKESGKQKVTRKQAAQQFSAKKSRHLVELLSQSYNSELKRLELTASVTDEVISIVKEYLGEI